MQRKTVRFDEVTFAPINLRRRDRRRSLQKIANEAFGDLHEKHGHPLELNGKLRAIVDRRPTTGQRD